jgi:hypothetical protein
VSFIFFLPRRDATVLLRTEKAAAKVTSVTSRTRKKAGSMKQLGQVKRQKSGSTGLGAETQTDKVVGLGSS